MVCSMIVRTIDTLRRVLQLLKRIMMAMATLNVQMYSMQMMLDVFVKESPMSMGWYRTAIVNTSKRLVHLTWLALYR